MHQEVEHIAFQNRHKPYSGFDMLRIEELFNRQDLDHSVDQHHLAKFYILAFIEKGTGFHSINFTDYPYYKGSIISIRKDQIQKFYKEKQTKGTLLLFTDEFLISYFEKLETQKSMLLFNECLGDPVLHLSSDNYSSLHSAIQRINEEYFNQHDEYSLGIIRSELHILINKIYRIKSKTGKIISQKKYLAEFITLQSLIEKKVTQHKSVKAYAQEMAVSTKTINNITQQIIHKSAKEFIDEICLKQIKGFLLNTELSIKEIAYTMGFDETSNFYKYFKRQTQTSPEKFRSSI